MTTNDLNIFKETIGYSESGGNYYNDRNQYWGKYQFGEARRRDIEAILGYDHHLTRVEFMPQVQEQFFTAHVQDLESKIYSAGLDSNIGNQITGIANNITATINIYGLVAGAHLGGFTGLKRYFESGGYYDPADAVGTHISDYIAKFSSIAEKKKIGRLA